MRFKVLRALWPLSPLSGKEVNDIFSTCVNVSEIYSQIYLGTNVCSVILFFFLISVPVGDS